MSILQGNLASYTRSFFMVQSADHITPLTGASPSVKTSRAGGSSFGSTGSTSEIGSGWYQCQLAISDFTPQPPGFKALNTGDFTFLATAASGDPVGWADQVQFSTFQQTTIDSGGNLAITSNVKKNTLCTGFMFLMTDQSTNQPKTGLTVSAQRLIDGIVFQPTANSPIEVGNGVYTLNFNPSDLNGGGVIFLMTANSANPLYLTILPQP